MNPCSTSDKKREDPGAQTTDHGPQTPTPSTIDRSTNCRCLCSCRCDSGLWSIVNTNSSMETQEAAELPIVSRIRSLIVSDDCADGKILPSKHIHIVVLFGLLRNVRNTGLQGERADDELEVTAALGSLPSRSLEWGQLEVATRAWSRAEWRSSADLRRKPYIQIVVHMIL